MSKKLWITVRFEGDVRAALKDFGLSSTAIKRLKRIENGILLNGQPAFTNARVCPGDEIIADMKEAAGKLRPAEGPVEIVYEDEDVCVLNKPSGLSVHPGPGNPDQSLGNYLARYFEARGEDDFVFRPVNRLDRVTSGLMLAAKSGYAHAQFIRQMQSGALQRRYLGLAEGCVEFGERVIDGPIRRKQGSPLLREVHGEGARAVTRAKVLQRGEDLTLMFFALETGRTHQIRVHMQSVGHPLYGDFLYGREREERCMLHCACLRFCSLRGGQTIALQQAPPKDFERVAAGHGIDVFRQGIPPAFF